MGLIFQDTRQEDLRQLLGQRCWDLLIVDQAHKVSATRYGKKLSKTNRYQLGEVLSGRCTHMLLLTATPHKGDETYFLLLDLLQPRLFACSEPLKQSALRPAAFQRAGDRPAGQPALQTAGGHDPGRFAPSGWAD